MFAEGRILQDPGPMRSRIAVPGEKRSFVFSVIEKAPVVSAAVANVFRTLAPGDVQLLPVSVEGETEPYFIVNATRTIDCIDEAGCREVHRYTEDDPFAESVGEYRWIYGLRIDPSKTEGASVLRPKGFKTAFVVSGEIRSALEGIGNLGVSFEDVTGSLK
ncbi:imm11 family protein [Corallococcus interemptor]|uniref:imm11 family protein n=1 Tax=Corallococcus interemptor TaxID=2316720 RepID=UPI003CFF2CE9